MTRIFAGRRNRFARSFAWYEPEEFGLYVLVSRQPRRWRWTALGQTRVVATDVDDEAGVAAIWLVRKRRIANSIAYTCLYKKYSDEWRSLGAASRTVSSDLMTDRPSCQNAGPAVVLVRGGSSGSLDRGYGLASPGPADRHGSSSPGTVADACWVACEEYRVALEVDQIEIANRRIAAPSHGHVIVVWQSPPGREPSGRPRIVALDKNGRVLTELATGEFVDGLTIDSSGSG